MKIPTNLHITKSEQLRLSNLILMINEKREKAGKEALEPSFIIHEILNDGLNSVEQDYNKNEKFFA